MISVKHETCLEYFRRRLREGWKCISLEGHNAVLLSPDGIRREIDLRNDVETLRPNAAGDQTNITTQAPSGGEHWDKVDDTGTGDEDSTRVHTATYQSWERDLYNLPPSSGSGTINFITVYFRCRRKSFPIKCKASLRIDGSTVDGTERTCNQAFPYTLYSQQWSINPVDTDAWEWADIDDLQIGVCLYNEYIDIAYCTQVYVEVDYTPGVMVSEISGFAITGYYNPAAPPLAVAQFYVPPEMRKQLTDGTILGMYWNCEVWCDITNNGDGPGTHNVHIWDSGGIVDLTIEVTLQPGETYTWYRSQWADFRRLSSYSVWAQGDWEGNNYSVARFP